MENGVLPQTFYHAKVAVFLFEQSLEAFLKAALVLDMNKFPKTHKLRDLLQLYGKSFPDLPFDRKTQIESFAVEEPGPPNEFLRYPENGRGTMWDDGCGGYDIPRWRRQVDLFLKEFERLEPLLKAAKRGAHTVT